MAHHHVDRRAVGERVAEIQQVAELAGVELAARGEVRGGDVRVFCVGRKELVEQDFVVVMVAEMQSGECRAETNASIAYEVRRGAGQVYGQRS